MCHPREAPACPKVAPNIVLLSQGTTVGNVVIHLWEMDRENVVEYFTRSHTAVRSHRPEACMAAGRSFFFFFLMDLKNIVPNKMSGAKRGRENSKFFTYIKTNAF